MLGIMVVSGWSVLARKTASFVQGMRPATGVFEQCCLVWLTEYVEEGVIILS
jgi:hypothetical protein